ncbi:MAG: hemolysin III family protein [Clostridia bacterium]|nr:hemolysin III family protein [Clostridia bacterium]
MKRTKLIDRILPEYTRGEEIFNMVSHIVGGAFGIVALILCVAFSYIGGDPYSLVSSFIYGISIVLLFTMSSVYHGLKTDTSKKVMQILDHCTIFILIAGTYTPYSLAAIRTISPVTGWVLFAAVWAVAVFGIVLNAIDLKSFKKFSLICYVALGWAALITVKPLIETITVPGFLYLLAGGIVYTVGAVIYGISGKGKHKKYMHSVFHIFVVAASVLHFISIFFYAIKW